MRKIWGTEILRINLLRDMMMVSLLLTLALLPPLSCDVASEDLIIVLDPGHGGSQSGAETLDGGTLEKNLNLKIARYLKEELEALEGVKVYMTREDDRDVGLDTRSEIAGDCGADLLVSLHNNAYDGSSGYDHGAFVLTASGNYREELSREEQKLACCILHELSELGIEDQGILLRASETGSTYPNGKTADYYRIIKDGILDNRMQILIEHAYIDYPEDYENYLSSEEALRALARADARGIARYYGLTREGQDTFPPLVNYEETLVTFKEGYETETRTEVFYPEEEIEEPEEETGEPGEDTMGSPEDPGPAEEGTEPEEDVNPAEEMTEPEEDTDQSAESENDMDATPEGDAEDQPIHIPFYKRLYEFIRLLFK